MHWIPQGEGDALDPLKYLPVDFKSGRFWVWPRPGGFLSDASFLRGRLTSSASCTPFMQGRIEGSESATKKEKDEE